MKIKERNVYTQIPPLSIKQLFEHFTSARSQGARLGFCLQNSSKVSLTEWFCLFVSYKQT